MSSEKQRRTFLSYSRINESFALKLAKELKAANFPVFFDQLDIPTGARWDTELEKALDECEVFMVILTPSSINSENVKDEIGYAIDHGKRILPVLLEESKIPLRLRRFQYVDFTTKSFDDGIESAKYLLRNLIDTPTALIPKSAIANKLKETQAETEQKVKIENDDLANQHLEKEKLENDRNGGTSKPSVKKTAQEKSERIDSPQNNDRRKPILLGVVGILVAIIALAGIFLMRKQPSSTTSVGMVIIPAGNYSVGTNNPVDLDAYWIDRYEITNSDYSKFIDATQNDPPDYWTNGEIPAGLRDHPVRQITWDQADEYCSWAGKRLPTEAEWEIAARGPFGWNYPWGNDPDKVKQETQSTQPVDSNPANRSYFGAYFMSGNVWEWVSDPYTSVEQGEYVLRGGTYGPLDVLTYAIPVTEEASSTQNAGFRCAASGENVVRQYDDNLALDDDFESTDTNWPGIHEDKFLFDYHELGFYHVEAREPNKYIPAFYEHDSYSNFVLETGVFVDKVNTDHEQGNFLYGLGVQISEDLFYAFVISANDQNWQVLKGTLIEGANLGNATDLTVVASGSDSSIQGASTETEDRLTVIANGTELIYSINGNLVYSFRIEAHQKVFVGFVVETLDNVTKVHIHYNWIQLQKIEPFENGVAKQEPTPTSIPATPTPTSPPTVTPTFAPPVTPFVRILEITIDGQQNYVVEYETYGYTETLPGTHIHFFFDTVPQEQAGVPGSGPWILYGGPQPFTKYRVSDRPGSAKQMCALVANSNHSIQLNSGNCVDLP